MPLITDSRVQKLKHILVSLILSLGVWYTVVGSEQVESQVEVRLDYRGLPENLVVRDGMIGKVAVRLRGSSEMLRGLASRDLTYTVSLAGVQPGANVLPLNVAQMAEFRAYELVDVQPGRLVLEVDTLLEKVVPLEADVVPLPKDAPLSLTQVLLEPSFVTVKGPESQIRPLEHLPVPFDPNRDPAAGTRAINIAIAAPAQVDITPPVTTLRYTLALKTQSVDVTRMVQLDAGARQRFIMASNRVELELEVPEDKVNDAEYLAGIRVVAQPPTDLAPGESADVPVLVMLPAGTRLTKVAPATVSVTRNRE